MRPGLTARPARPRDRTRRGDAGGGPVLRGLALLGAGSTALGGAGIGVAQAQGGTRVTGSVDVGAASVAYDEFARSAVLSVTPMVRVERARTMFVARGAYSRFESGNESVQAAVAASVVTPAVWHLRGELFGTASTTRYRDEPAASNVGALGRLHWADRDVGFWLGAGVGGVAQRNRFPSALLQGDVGVWRRLGRTVYSVTATPTRLGAASAEDFPLRGDGDRLAFVDYAASMRWQHPAAEVVATAGYRSALSTARLAGAPRWLEVWTTLWFTRRLALVGGVGAFPTDVQQGLPGGRYASAALRIATGRPPVNDPLVRAELTVPYEINRLRRGRADASRFTVGTNALTGLRVLTVQVSGAGEVELMGDFTDWLPVRLSPAGRDVWRVELPIAPGVHRVNLRVDRGPWTAPPGLTAVDDEFGGRAGLLVVQ